MDPGPAWCIAHLKKWTRHIEILHWAGGRRAGRRGENRSGEQHNEPGCTVGTFPPLVLLPRWAADELGVLPGPWDFGENARSWSKRGGRSVSLTRREG